MPPVATLVVLTSVPFLYRLMVAGEGLLTSMRVQVPVTATLDPLVIGELSVGAAVVVAPTPDPPAVISVRLMVGCALITVCQAESHVGIGGVIDAVDVTPAALQCRGRRGHGSGHHPQ